MSVMMARGSEWRRWDLHVHTPDTALEDRFGGWDEYLAKIEAHRDVKVIGVTDYMTITNYSRLKKYKEEGRIKNIKLLIPNIEFRIAPSSQKATAINIHFLISPDDPKHENKILEALARLEFEYKKNNYSCTPDQLIDLGRAHKNTNMNDRAALREGVKQFKVSFDILKTWYRKEQWFQDNSLVAVSAGKDGLSGFCRDGGWGGFRDEITRFSELIFSGRPGEREFWLGKGSPEDENVKTVFNLGGPKPCVHGSDAHSIDKLFEPDKSRYCWIKADPTFEGLRQTLYEPEDRVYIGPMPPDCHDETRVIRSIYLANSDGWLNDVKIPLNTNLVSIIGQKGSGKSALAELVAYATGSWEADKFSSFLERAKKYLENMKIIIKWVDGTEDSITLWDKQDTYPKIRYLSQKFVERLCSEDKLADGLVREIETVIFSHLDPSETMGASNFDELRKIRTGGIQEEGRRLRNETSRLIHEEFKLRVSASKLGEKRNRVNILLEECSGLQKQIPTAFSPEDEKIMNKLQEKRQSLNERQQEIAQKKQTLQKINDIRRNVEACKAQMNHHYGELVEQLSEVGVSDKDFKVFKIEFAGDTETPLAQREAILRKQIKDCVGSTENPSEGTILWLQEKIENLEKQQIADKAYQKKIMDIQNRIIATNSEIEKIKTEITRIEGPEKKRIETALEKRRAAYVDYFLNLKQEQEVLKDLYAPVTKRLQSETALEQERQLEFSIRWIVDVKNWIDRGRELFDKRRSMPYGNMEGMIEAARGTLIPAWESGDSVEIACALKKFLEEFSKKEYQPPTRYLQSDTTHEHLLQWLYEVKHVSLRYGLRYNGTDLRDLSPGTKGIVLLILYLGIDINDTRPLIIDQPDDNLDNESIFQLLSKYFQDAKKRRQIILITHNPNLVVNTDSEQVIVAHAEPRDSGLPHIQYSSGALEDAGYDEDGIRQQVCRILEGGSEAFLKRERRYALKM